MDHEYRMLINGKLVHASDNAQMEIINPADGNAFAVAPKGSPVEVEKAVEAAWNAQASWGSMYAGDRSRFLFKLAELIRKHYDELWRLETMQYGGPMSKTANFDIPVAADMLEWMAGIGRGLSGLTLPVGSSARAMTVREPLGVLGLITPWNFPLVTAIAKISPALITGNTCVVKPPSCAPLTVLRLAEFAVEAGLPAGVLNIVTGPGNTVGEALVVHPKVAKINFTGDSSTGKRIMSLASTAVKPVASELGGKNAFIVMNDADLDATVEGAVWGSFFNAGQNCGSCSRFFIQESIYEQFVERFVSTAKKIVIGNPLKPETMVGPVAYKGHRDGIERFIEGARRSKARLLLGGERPSTPETKNGYFVTPTIFADCDPKSEFMQEEIFGPVVGVTRFTTPEEAVALTNDTRYGLCASLWTEDVRQGMVMANQIKVGTVWINQHLSIVFEIPWGGCKESGWSKENSTLALEEYTMQKHLWIDLAGTPHTPWENMAHEKSVRTETANS